MVPSTRECAAMPASGIRPMHATPGEAIGQSGVLRAGREVTELTCLSLRLRLLPPMPSPLPSGVLAGKSQVAGRVDECDVGQSLREIADHPPALCIKLFSEQPDIVPNCEKALEYRHRLRFTALQSEHVGIP